MRDIKVKSGGSAGILPAVRLGKNRRRYNGFFLGFTAGGTPMNRGGQDARAPSERSVFTSMSRTRLSRGIFMSWRELRPTPGRLASAEPYVMMAEKIGERST